MSLLHPLLLLLSRCTPTQHAAAAAAIVCPGAILASCAQHCRPELRLSEGPRTCPEPSGLPQLAQK